MADPHIACLDTLALVKAVLTDDRDDIERRVEKAQAILTSYGETYALPHIPAA